MSDKPILPKVSEGIEGSIKAEYLGNEEKYVSELIEKVKKENPIIIKFLGDCLSGISKDNEEAKKAIIYSGLFVYKLLESQAQANKLEEDILGKD
ncbi:hypothetical protein HZA97_09715 [Candidatus Woesearchaeota archaeon]|nr:hypothetical protein [Candidatus Woesearchaeota archaeon]